MLEISSFLPAVRKKISTFLVLFYFVSKSIRNEVAPLSYQNLFPNCNARATIGTCSVSYLELMCRISVFVGKTLGLIIWGLE